MMMTNPMCAEKANNGLLNITECSGNQSDVPRNPPNVALDYLECTNFGQFFVIFPIFQPLWCHTGAAKEPKLPVKVPFNFYEEHGELYRSGKGGPNIKIWLCRQVPLDAPVFADCEIVDSTLREELPIDSNFLRKPWSLMQHR